MHIFYIYSHLGHIRISNFRCAVRVPDGETLTERVGTRGYIGKFKFLMALIFISVVCRTSERKMNVTLLHRKQKTLSYKYTGQ